MINVPDSFNTEDATDGYQIRRCATDFGVSLITNVKCAVAFVSAMHQVKEMPIFSMGDMYAMGESSHARPKAFTSTSNLIGNRARTISNMSAPLPSSPRHSPGKMKLMTGAKGKDIEMSDI